MRRWQHRPEGSNWGEFGADDQRGRMNLLTPARRLAAVREVREGLVFSLSLPLDYPGGPGLWETRAPPKLAATRFKDGRSAYPFHMSSYAGAGHRRDLRRRGHPEPAVLHAVGCARALRLGVRRRRRRDAPRWCSTTAYRGGEHIASPDAAGGGGARRARHREPGARRRAGARRAPRSVRPSTAAAAPASATRR